MQKSNTRTPWVFYAGLIILCCFLVSTHFTGGLYAKYSTTSYGEDSARVAKFNVGSNISTVDAPIELNFFDEGKFSDTFAFNVTSSSEVAVQYDVIITMPEAADYSWLDIMLKPGDGEEIPATRAANVFTIENVANIAPNDVETIANVLTFSIKVGNQGNPPDGLMDVSDAAQITVRMAQID